MADQGQRGRGRGGRGGRGRGGMKRPAYEQSQEYNEEQDYSEIGFGRAWRPITLQENSYRFLVSANNAPLILGSKGRNILSLMERVKKIDPEASIHVSGRQPDGKPLMEGCCDNIMTLKANTQEGLEQCLFKVIPFLQSPNPDPRKRKAELRMIVPNFCCGLIVGPKGKKIYDLKQRTGSFVQIYQHALPLSEECVIRIQNLFHDELVNTVVSICNQIQYNKTQKMLVPYVPIWFEPGSYDNTGSYLDTNMYEEGIEMGFIDTPYINTKKEYEEPQEYEYGYQARGGARGRGRGRGQGRGSWEVGYHGPPAKMTRGNPYAY